MYQKIILEDQSYLEPYVSKETIDYHYQLYLRYYNKLINILNEQGYDYRYTLKELVNHLDIFPIDKRDDILVALGGVLNHELYFKSMSKEKSNSFDSILIESFGSVDNFKKKWIEAANEMVGSGYTFLVLNKNKKLEILDFSNQDTPYSYDLIPILNLDLWEHSYYLDYRIHRNNYIDIFFDLINFDQVNQNYEKALKLL